MKVAGLFPGQGSQAVGMGRDFVESDERARNILAQADEALGFPLSNLMFNGPLEELTLTENAQPAILTVSYICFVLSEAKLNGAAGHSLGEYTALVASGALDFLDAVKIVHKRGHYMQEAVEPGAGKMVAVMGPGEEEIIQAISTLPQAVVQIANINSPGQIVVAGEAAGIDAFSEKMQESGAKIIPLNVSAPFHCALMKPAADKLALILDQTVFKDPQFPVIANVTANPITTGPEARELLKKQVCATVRWSKSMDTLISLGFTHTVEFGHGGVLTKLMKRINKDMTRLEVSDQKSLTAFRAIFK